MIKPIKIGNIEIKLEEIGTFILCAYTGFQCTWDDDGNPICDNHPPEDKCLHVYNIGKEIR